MTAEGRASGWLGLTWQPHDAVRVALHIYEQLGYPLAIIALVQPSDQCGAVRLWSGEYVEEFTGTAGTERGEMRSPRASGCASARFRVRRGSPGLHRC